MKAYHTYNAVEVAFIVLKHADLQGKRLTHLQLQKLTYVCHGVSLAYYYRPMFLEDVFAWKYGPVVPSVFFRFKSHGAGVIGERDDSIIIDEESDFIICSVIESLGDLTGPQLVELTHRENSPWTKVWDGSIHKIIPDEIIQAHYTDIQNSGHTSSL